MSATVPCPQPECKAHEDGKCIEGLDLSTCPHWKGRTAHSTPDDEPGRLEDLVDWPSGKGVAAEERGVLSRARQTRTVLVAGEPFTGKTTLIGALYIAFHRGSIGPFRFAGSETLLGFEERCFRARLASGGSSAETAHTPVKQSTVLHLAIDNMNTGARKDLVLADISGELLKEIYESPGTARMMPIALESERVALLLDARRLVDKRQRHALVARSSQLARVLYEKRITSTERPLLVVVTKCDFLPQESAEWDEVRNQTQKVTEAATFATSVFTAARRGPGLPPGAGFEELLNQWTAPTLTAPTLRTASPARAFDLYDARGEG